MLNNRGTHWSTITCAVTLIKKGRAGGDGVANISRITEIDRFLRKRSTFSACYFLAVKWSVNRAKISGGPIFFKVLG